MRSNPGTSMEELLDLFRRGEAHHPLDAGAVVPGAVEQHDFAGGRQVRHVALESTTACCSRSVGAGRATTPADARVRGAG